MNNIDHVKEITELVDKYVRIFLEDAWERGRRLVGNESYPRIKFDLKGQSAGQHQFNKLTNAHLLRFNLDIAMLNWDDYGQTVAHEVAHWATMVWVGLEYSGARRISHGKAWKHIMTEVFGKAPNLYHNYSMPERKGTQRRFDYNCGCMIHKMATVTHNRIQKGQRLYSCQHCKGELKWSRS